MQRNFTSSMVDLVMSIGNSHVRWLARKSQLAEFQEQMLIVDKRPLSQSWLVKSALDVHISLDISKSSTAFSGWLQFSEELDWWSTHITALI